MVKCKKCNDTGWVPATEPYGGLLRQVQGVLTPCICKAAPKKEKK